MKRSTMVSLLGLFVCVTSVIGLLQLKSKAPILSDYKDIQTKTVANENGDSDNNMSSQMIAFDSISIPGGENVVTSDSMTEGDGKNKPLSTVKNVEVDQEDSMTILGMVVDNNVQDMGKERVEREITRLENYIDKNNIYKRLNSGEISEKEMPEYTRFFTYLTKLQSRGMEIQVGNIEADLQYIAETQPIINQQYESGDLYDNSKYSEEKFKSEQIKLAAELNSKHQAEDEASNRLIADVAKMIADRQ